MVTRALFKDSLREIWKYPARFLSIFAIVAIGAALFVGIKGTAPNMKFTADQYYDQYHMMDIRVLSTLGLVDEDIAAIRGVEGVEIVQPGYFVDVSTTVDASEFIYRVHSLPATARSAGDAQQYLNMPKLMSGRMPTQPGEAVIEVNRNIDSGLRLGDTMVVSSGTKDDLSGVLKTTSFTVVGTVVSPYYLTFQREPSEIGSGRVNLFMMVSEDEFLYPVYTEALVAVTGASRLDSYSTEYTDLVGKVASQLENLGTERATLRLASLKAQAQAKLDEGKAELAAKEAEYNQLMADGEAQLLEASNKLAAGRAALDTARQDYATQMAAYKAMLAQWGPQLAQAERQVNQLQAQYGPMLAQAEAAMGQLDQATTNLNQVQADSAASMASIRAQLGAGNLTPDETSRLEGQLAREQQIYDSAGQALGQIDPLGNTANSQIKSAQNQLRTAKNQVANARKQMNQAQASMDAASSQAAAKFAAAEAEIAAGQTAYDEAKAEFETKKAEGAAAIQAGRDAIIRAENEIERLQEPTWYVLDRSKVYSYADYDSTADRMDAIAALFPVFFFAVAALVCLTTMTRMIDEQRTSIGTYKALGYPRGAIAFKYVFYAALASLLGGAVGVAVGIKVFPRIIFDSWSMMYELPPMREAQQAPLLVLTVLIATALITATAYAAVRNELQTVPAALMRPKSPKAGKVIMLERFAPLWSRLSFSQKVTMRNIFRYKKRFFMTVVGVAGCAALLVAGLGLNDSIGQIVPRQYGQIYTHDIFVRLATTTTDSEAAALVADLDADAAVAGTLELSQHNAVVRGTDEEISATLLTPLDMARFGDFVKLRERESQRPLTLPEAGVVVTEKLAKELGVGVGDRISVDAGNGVFKKLQIAAITENYLFHYIYMSPASYEDTYRRVPATSGLMIQMADRTAQDRLGSSLIESDKAASVFYYSDASDKFAETIVSLNTIVWAMIVSAGLLAFVVLYNLTNINLSERLREIATIKVLGFYNREVASYVYRENFMLTFIGGLVGLVVGVGLHRAIMASIEQNDVMFGNFISPMSFVNALAITMVFGVIVSIVMYRRLTTIKMVESLKSVE